jgi:hypothetical protein
MTHRFSRPLDNSTTMLRFSCLQEHSNALESFRIADLLSRGALVVSEKSSRGSEQEYADLVDFVALGGKGGVSRFEKAPNLAPLSYSHGQ